MASTPFDLDVDAIDIASKNPSFTPILPAGVDDSQ